MIVLYKNYFWTEIYSWCQIKFDYYFVMKIDEDDQHVMFPIQIHVYDLSNILSFMEV